nr:MAG TPA: hypothetical protein [Caudoviricetes sp.]
MRLALHSACLLISPFFSQYRFLLRSNIRLRCNW